MALFLALAFLRFLKRRSKVASKVGLQRSHQTHAFLEFQALFREALRSPREASVDQFPATLSLPHLRLKTSPSFLPPAETWYLSPARQEPPRDQFAKAKVFREPVRSQPLHKSMPCVAISEAPQQPKKHGSFELVKSCLQSLKAMVFQQCWPSRLASLKSSRGPLLCGTSTKCHLEALEDLEGHAQTNFPS